MNIANRISLARLFFGPIFLFVYLGFGVDNTQSVVITLILTALLGLASFSDWVDGYLARKYHLVTNLGKLIDPMSDSLATISVYLTFTFAPINLPMPLVFVFIYRDMLMSTLRTLAALKGIALAASMTGKIKTWIQNVSCYIILAMLLAYQLQWITQQTLHTVSAGAVAIAAGFSIYSGVEYLVNNWKVIRSEIK